MRRIGTGHSTKATSLRIDLQQLEQDWRSHCVKSPSTYNGVARFLEVVQDSNLEIKDINEALCQEYIRSEPNLSYKSAVRQFSVWLTDLRTWSTKY